MLPLSDDGISIPDSNHTDETKAAAGQIRRSPAGRGCDNRPWTGAVSDWCFPGKMILSDLFSDSRYAASKSHPRCTPFPVCMTMSSPAVRDFRGICRLLPFVLPDNLFGLLCRRPLSSGFHPCISEIHLLSTEDRPSPVPDPLHKNRIQPVRTGFPNCLKKVLDIATGLISAGSHAKSEPYRTCIRFHWGLHSNARALEFKFLTRGAR